MKFDALSFVMGQQAGKASGGFTETILMEKQTLSGFAPDERFGGKYTASIAPPPCVLKIGETYTVEWEGEEYTVVAQDTSALFAGSVSAGNLVMFGMTGNNEPFAICSTETRINFLSLDTEPSHEIKIYQKVASGNDYSDVHFVTFMSEDGTTELYKRPVADGDDCADPVIRGLISEPTKESTAQYNYTLVGWSASPNGALDENILKSVTADKTVYANFAAVLRYYTITYYDSDGTTVLKTESLAYGTMPSYAPKKEGYTLVGWEPAFATVTDNASYVAQFEEAVTFADASWSKIAEIAEAGTAANYFAIGDTKTIAVTYMNSNTDSTSINNNVSKTYELTFEIIGFNHDDLSDGSGKAGITVASRDSQTIGRLLGLSLGQTNTIIGRIGWANNPVRTALNDTVYNNIEENARQHIKSVIKKTGKSSSDSALEETVDKVFIPSAQEFIGDFANGYTAKGQGTKYARYATDADRQKKYFLGGTVSSSYDFHTSRSGYNTMQNVEFNASGYLKTGTNGSNKAVIAFCI